MLFAFYDKDKNGLIESSEFLKVVSAVYDYKGLNKKEYSPQKCMNDLFRKLDVNKDLKLSKEEFISGCLANKNISVNKS